MLVVYGPAGWVRIDDAGLPGVAAVYMRLTESGEVIEVHLTALSGHEVGANALRSMPLARFRALALSRPDLLAMQFGAPDPGPGEALDDAFPRARRSKGVDADARLAQPPGGLDDEFLRQVAAADAAAVARGERPNVTLAEQAGAPVRTVQRWVYTARQRGIMPRGGRGRVS